VADLGDTLGFRADLYDKPVEQGGALVNATTVVLSILKPDGTTLTPTVANPPAVTGKYLFDQVSLTTDPAGRWVGTWFFTLSSGKTSSYIETFDVGPTLITIDEALMHLRALNLIKTAVDLEQLQFLCFVATDAVERDLGRVMTRKTFVESYTGGSDFIVLDQTPVISITTVVENGVTLAGTDYLLDSPILWRGNTLSAQCWGWGRLNVVITYAAGFLNPPVIARKVALNAVQKMWQESQQASHPMIDELGESFVMTAVGLLTPVEKQAYDSLRMVPVA
jgi:hypothetical protein